MEDINSDADGTMDCENLCPNGDTKMELGVSRCNVPDTDLNGNGMLDCQAPKDNCPNNPDKYDAGYCGCRVADINSDSNGTPNHLDECPKDMTKIVLGICSCSVWDKDSH